MAKSRIAHRSANAGDLSCDADRLTAVLMAIEHGTDPNQDFAVELGGELQLALLYELLPLAIRMSRQLSADLERLDEQLIKSAAA